MKAVITGNTGCSKKGEMQYEKTQTWKIFKELTSFIGFDISEVYFNYIIPHYFTFKTPFSLV